MTKRIKLLKPYGLCVAGSIQNFPVPIADQLIRRKVAEEVKEAQAHTPIIGKVKKLKKNANR